VRDEDSTGHRREWCQIRPANGEPQAHGTWTAWHDNGAKSVEGQMRHGRQVGYWTFWDDRGRVIEVVSYEDGRDRSGAREGSDVGVTGD
jgi:antitoxin component YwqK of YwqJK toxin-antitoxin module